MPTASAKITDSAMAFEEILARRGLAFRGHTPTTRHGKLKTRTVSRRRGPRQLPH
jgi:hypothetical protein